MHAQQSWQAQGMVFFPVRFTHSSHQQNAKQKQNGPLSLERVRPVRALWRRDSPTSTSPAGLPCGFWLWKDPRRYHVDDPRPCSQTWSWGKHSKVCELFEFMDIYVASLLYYVFTSLQDDQPAPVTRSHLKLAVVLKDEEWALQTAESQDCFLMIFFYIKPPSICAVLCQTNQ